MRLKNILLPCTKSTSVYCHPLDYLLYSLILFIFVCPWKEQHLPDGDVGSGTSKREISRACHAINKKWRDGYVKINTCRIFGGIQTGGYWESASVIFVSFPFCCSFWFFLKCLLAGYTCAIPKRTCGRATSRKPKPKTVKRELRTITGKKRGGKCLAGNKWIMKSWRDRSRSQVGGIIPAESHFRPIIMVK